MTACSSGPTGLSLRTPVRPSPAQVLLGSGVAFVAALCFFSIVWMRLERWFSANPLLTIPLLVSMVWAPLTLFIGVRRITEVGLRSKLVLSVLLSATAIVLTAFMFVLSLQHTAGR